MGVKKGLLYTEDHEWVAVDGNVVTLGISAYAAEHLGDIVYIDLPMEDDEFDAGDAVASIESVKAASDLYTQVGGTVVEVNEALEDEPELVNEDAYENWIVKLEINDESELEALLSDEDYEKLLAEEA